jgi:hypothetical protein
LDLQVRGEIFERQNIVGWEAKDGFDRERAGQFAGCEDGGVERFGSLVVGHDDDAGGSGGSDEERQVQGSGCEGQAGDTSAPRACAQVASYTLEGCGVLKVRE